MSLIGSTTSGLSEKSSFRTPVEQPHPLFIRSSLDTRGHGSSEHPAETCKLATTRPNFTLGSSVFCCRRKPAPTAPTPAGHLEQHWLPAVHLIRAKQKKKKDGARLCHISSRPPAPATASLDGTPHHHVAASPQMANYLSSTLLRASFTATTYEHSSPHSLKPQQPASLDLTHSQPPGRSQLHSGQGESIKPSGHEFMLHPSI